MFLTEISTDEFVCPVPRSCLSVNGETMVYAAYKYKIRCQSCLSDTKHTHLYMHAGKQISLPAYRHTHHTHMVM